jgi:hypothetical protein
LAGRLAGGTPLLSEPWTGWRPVKLPLRVQDPPRREIRQGQTVYRLYWADLHCHSNLSADAEGEPDELLHYARDRARLDVVVFTENDAIYDVFLTEGEFAYGMWWANRFTRPGRFVALPGYEWSSRIPKSPDVDLADPRNWDARYYGTAPKDWAKTASGISSPDHRSVIYPPEGGPVVRYPEVGNDVRKLVEAVALAGGLAHPHHAAWRLSGNPVEANIEVTSGWDIYIRDPSRIHQELRRGRRFGFLGNSDSHRRNPGLGGGLTGIYAEALTPEAILEALRSRRVYATSGSRIVVDSRAGGSLMGQEAAAPEGDIDIQLDVVGARPILEAALIRDGDTVKTFAGYGSSRLSVVHHERSLSRGVHWCYWRIVQQGASPNYPGNVKTAEGPLAWSSPHWVIVP